MYVIFSYTGFSDRGNCKKDLRIAHKYHSSDSQKGASSKCSTVVSQRDDPLMSDLLWEKVDTDDECMPRLKQETLTSEEDSIDSDHDTFSNSICDYFINEESGRHEKNVNDRFEEYNKSGYKCSTVTDSKFPLTKNVTKSTSKQRKVAHLGVGNQNTQTNEQIPMSVKNISTSHTNHSGKKVTNFDDFRISSTTKKPRKRITDTSKKVNDLLTQQLSIMWCLKEFENKPSDTEGDSDNKSNVLGQVIRQGKDIYFQPTAISPPDLVSEGAASTTRVCTRTRQKQHKASATKLGSTASNSHQTSELESGEIESDTTTISVDPPKAIKKIKKKKKTKKSKRASSAYRRSIYRGKHHGRHHIPKTRTTTRQSHAVNRYSYSKHSGWKESLSRDNHFASSEDEMERRRNSAGNQYNPSRRTSTESNRSRDKSRSIHSRGCSR